MIRKRGKANWEHECRVCKLTSTHPDQFRAIEAHQKHANSLGHLGAAIVEGFRPFRDLLEAFTAPLPRMPGLDAKGVYAQTLEAHGIKNLQDTPKLREN